MTIPNFVELPTVLDASELLEIQDALMRAEGEAADVARRLLQERMALLTRLQLAELALYRAALLTQDMGAEIDAGRRRRAGPPTAEGIANMAVRYARDYVGPVLKAVREATGYTEGSEREGRYMMAEDVRAKLLGSERAKERLEREGHPGLP